MGGASHVVPCQLNTGCVGSGTNTRGRHELTLMPVSGAGPPIYGVGMRTMLKLSRVPSVVQLLFVVHFTPVMSVQAVELMSHAPEVNAHTFAAADHVHGPLQVALVHDEQMLLPGSQPTPHVFAVLFHAHELCVAHSASLQALQSPPLHVLPAGRHWYVCGCPDFCGSAVHTPFPTDSQRAFVQQLRVPVPPPSHTLSAALAGNSAWQLPNGA